MGTSAFADALDALSLAVLIVDPGGFILYCNRSAQRILTGVGLLGAGEVGEGDRFAYLPPEGEGGLVLIAPPPSVAEFADCLLIHVRTEFDPVLGNVRVVFILSPRVHPCENMVAFSQVFGLSRTEHRILVQIFSGLNSAEIARAEKMSVHTVRAHIKSIMKKTGVHRQSMLVRKVADATQVRLAEPAAPVAPSRRGRRALPGHG